jgi:hypothetical protein
MVSQACANAHYFAMPTAKVYVFFIVVCMVI